MQKYYFRKQTPLRFHKFFHYFSLPLGILQTLSQAVVYYSDGFQNWLYGVDFIHFLATVGLMLACFIGFFKWKPYAWYCLMTHLAVQVTYNLFCVVVYGLYVPDELASALGNFVGHLISSILIGIYYYKRKPLFICPWNVKTEQWQISHVLPEMDSDSGANQADEIRFCRKCGAEIMRGSMFCHKCGDRILPPGP